MKKKWIITVPLLASIVSLPLVASACDKKQKNDTKNKEIAAEAKKVKVDIDNKATVVPSTVKNTDLKFTGFDAAKYSVEDIKTKDANDKEGKVNVTFRLKLKNENVYSDFVTLELSGLKANSNATPTPTPGPTGPSAAEPSQAELNEYVKLLENKLEIIDIKKADLKAKLDAGSDLWYDRVRQLVFTTSKGAHPVWNTLTDNDMLIKVNDLPSWGNANYQLCHPDKPTYTKVKGTKTYTNISTLLKWEKRAADNHIIVSFKLGYFIRNSAPLISETAVSADLGTLE